VLVTKDRMASDTNRCKREDVASEI